MNDDVVMFETLGSVARLTLNRPKAMNALNLAILAELDRRLIEVAARDELPVLVLTGSGSAFGAGAGLKELLAAQKLAPDEADVQDRANDVYGRQRNFPAPVIARVQRADRAVSDRPVRGRTSRRNPLMASSVVARSACRCAGAQLAPRPFGWASAALSRARGAAGRRTLRAGNWLAGFVIALVTLGTALAQNAPPSAKLRAQSAPTAIAFEPLTGNWVRPDGGYRIEIRSVGPGGQLEAMYFNPGPLPFAKAHVRQDGSFVRLTLELQAGGYNGSTYELTYEEASDQLKGTYYQAVMKQKFEVVFTRK